MIAGPSYDKIEDFFRKGIEEYLKMEPHSAEAIGHIMYLSANCWPSHQVNGTMSGLKQSDIFKIMKELNVPASSPDYYDKQITQAETWEKSISRF